MSLGDTPYSFRGGQSDGKRLFYSNREQAFLKSISIPAGFGVVPSGQVMGIITESANRKGRYVPYVSKTAAAGVTNACGVTYLVQDASGTELYVNMNDSYKFAVGDHIAIDGESSPEDLGAITAIDRTTYSHMAVITVTNSITGPFTVANGAWIFIQTSTATAYTTAKGILVGAVDTGVGENAKGGDGVLCLGNAMLYKDSLYQYDANVLSDLGGSEDAPYLILK